MDRCSWLADEEQAPDADRLAYDGD